MDSSLNSQELIELCQAAKSTEDIYSICSIASTQFGFEQFMYGSRIPTSFVSPQLILISGYREDWWDHYTKQEYMKIDPIVNHGANNIVPFRWHELNPPTRDNKCAQQLMNESKEFGFNSGISFPVHTPRGETAMLSFSTSETPQIAQSHMLEAEPHLLMLAYHIHDASMRIFRNSATIEPAITLTPREKECLLWAAEGKTSDETALILHISESTVRFHLSNAANKLNVRTRRHAIARAISLGLIAPVA
ncbi:MAG: LuxR family transcriptional regulator [Candidatus Thiodiazotropha sp. (ex Semelilucina semeliformis)]|nr:LuxR family transcriptional regulator [Candidatus Thiodiazotropha sp. (ex Semelilucina semeliformis)]